MAPIHDAAREGDLQRVTAVLDAGGNVNRKARERGGNRRAGR